MKRVGGKGGVEGMGRKWEINITVSHHHNVPVPLWPPHSLTSPTDKPPLSPVVSQTHFAECSGCRSTIFCWTCCGAGAKGLEREHRDSSSNSRYVRRCKQEATRSETSDNNLYMYRVFHRLMESCTRTLMSTTSVHLH